MVTALDSFGKVESGILLGNIKWYGQYYECLNLHHDHFNGQWCGADFGQPSYVSSVHIFFEVESSNEEDRIS